MSNTKFEKAMFIESPHGNSISRKRKVKIEIELDLLLKLIQKYLESYKTPKQAIGAAIYGARNPALVVHSINQQTKIDPEVAKEVKGSSSKWQCAFYDCADLMKNIWSEIDK